MSLMQHAICKVSCDSGYEKNLVEVKSIIFKLTVSWCKKHLKLIIHWAHREHLNLNEGDCCLEIE